MLTPNQLNLIADKLRMLRGRIHAELGTTLRQSDSAHAADLRRQLQEIAADLGAIEEEHAYVRSMATSISDRPQAPATTNDEVLMEGKPIWARQLYIPEERLCAVVMKPGEGVDVYLK